MIFVQSDGNHDCAVLGALLAAQTRIGCLVASDAAMQITAEYVVRRMSQHFLSAIGSSPQLFGSHSNVEMMVPVVIVASDG